MKKRWLVPAVVMACAALERKEAPGELDLKPQRTGGSLSISP